MHRRLQYDFTAKKVEYNRKSQFTAHLRIHSNLQSSTAKKYINRAYIKKIYLLQNSSDTEKYERRVS